MFFKTIGSFQKTYTAQFIWISSTISMYLSEHILVAGFQCMDNNYVSFINNNHLYSKVFWA